MKHCIACGKMLPSRSLFELTDAPASAQDIPDEIQVKTDRGVTLELHQCDQCGLVQFDCEPVSYYKDVIRAGGFSTTMTELRRTQYRHLIETYHLEGKKFIEVGCGRGEFLNVLTEFPVQTYGMEHKADLVEMARAQGLNVWREFPDTADQVFAEGKEGKFDVFLSFNFLEHQPYPEVMLQAIYNNLSEDGMGLVTVPSLEYILDKGSYYELIRDHIAYYSFGTLKSLLERNGFKVLEEERINRDTIAMIVQKMPRGAVEDDGVRAVGEKAESAAETGLETAGQDEKISVKPLTDGYDIVTAEIAAMLDELQKSGKTLAIWGASHQGFTLAATTQLKDHVEYIIDSAPFKQGRFAPASHLPILSPDDAVKNPVGAILIVAPGYTDEIAGIIKERFGEQMDIRTLRTNHIEKLR